MYNPSVGVFATEDPTGFDAGDDNLYRFVGNDPTNSTDPTGLQEKEQAVCQITSVKLIRTKADFPEGLITTIAPGFPTLKGEAKLNLANLGPYNDPNMDTDFQNSFWILWQGTNLQDCEVKNYVINTITMGDETRNFPKKSEGYVAGKNNE
jgi:uncharacterized protein RhaS with RHS repeats